MSAPPATKKKGFNFLQGITFLLELAIAFAAAIWLIYSYIPQYYLVLSFVLLAVVGVAAYVFLMKAVNF